MEGYTVIDSSETAKLIEIAVVFFLNANIFF